MSQLLYVISSPRGEQSESRGIADEFLHTYTQADPGVDVDVLDLWTDPLPAYGGKGVAAKMAVLVCCADAAAEKIASVARTARLLIIITGLLRVVSWRSAVFLLRRSF